MHVGVLQAAVVLLEEEQPGADAARAAAIESTVALLRTAISQAADDPGTGRAG